MNIYSADLRSLKTFCADYPEATPLVLYRGMEKVMVNDIICWPVDIFLKQLIPNHKLPE